MGQWPQIKVTANPNKMHKNVAFPGRITKSPQRAHPRWEGGRPSPHLTPPRRLLHLDINAFGILTCPPRPSLYKILNSL